MSRQMTPRSRSDEGAVAVLMAILALLLVSIAALSVDLGAAYVHKHALQKRTDFAALAGGNGDQLPVTANGTTCVNGVYTWTAARASDDAIEAVADYLTKERTTTVQPAQLVDCNLYNGEANYGTWARRNNGVEFSANENQLSVISPPERVDFGLARVMGFESVDVLGQATVEIKTLLQQTLPLYAFQGCDYGLQTIAQPTNGQSSDGVNLASGSDNNDYITEVSPLVLNPLSVTNPPTVALGSTTTTVTIAGTRLDQVLKVGFFRSDPTSPPPPVEVVPPNFVVTGTTTITLTIPTDVTSVEDVWYIRLYGPDRANGQVQNKWTPVRDNGNANNQDNLNALPIQVGASTLSCDQGSTSGTFGTLNLFNSSPGAPNGQDENIAYNIAYGLQYGLAPYPTAFLTPPDYTCVEDQDGVAKEWPQEGTNCVNAQPGFPQQAATQGLVTGVGSADRSLLKETDPETFCPGDYPTGTTHVATAPTGDLINNDVLTCFFENGTVTVADVSSQSYNGGAVISQAIYDSPRFVLVPVLGKGPDNQNLNYEIVDFRPGFITDQPGTATRATGAPSSNNGLVWAASGNTSRLMAVQIVFLNPDSLYEPPIDPDGKYIPYVGSGKKSLLLVN